MISLWRHLPIDMRLLASALSLLGLALLWAPAASPVLAHATYVRSDPASGGQLATPGRIRVLFTEDVDAGFSEMQVLDAARRRVDLNDTRAVPGDPKSLTVSVPQLADGTYTVAWKTLSAVDGHTARGIFPVVVGAGGLEDISQVEQPGEAPVYPPEVLLRGLTFFGTLALVGGLAFWGLVLAPSLGPSGGRSTRVAGAQFAWERRLRQLGTALAAVTLAVSLVWLLVQAAAASETSLADVVGQPLVRWLGTRNGLMATAKVIALALLLGCFWRFSGSRLVVGGLSLGGISMLLTSLTSHAAALPRGAELVIVVDWLHQAGAALWLGGLVALLVAAPEIARARPTDRAGLLARLVPRFSSLAMISVGLLVITGSFNALVQVGSIQALGSLYGGALIVKIAGLLPMLALGAINLLVFKPRFVQAAQRRARAPISIGVAGLLNRFRLILVGEVALGVAILLATGVLTTAEPARDVFARRPKPLELSGPAEDLRVDVRIEPGRVGQNTFAVEVRDSANRPAPDIQRVQLRFTYLDQDLGQGARIADPQPEVRYVADGNDLSVAGRWQIEVAVRRLNREDAVAAFRFDLGTTAGEGSSAIPLPAFTSSFVSAALALLLVGLGLGVWILRADDLPSRQRRGYALACALVTLLSALYVVRAASFGPDLRSVRNPIPPSSASLGRGQEVYRATGCVDCHGESGRGDGILGRTLRPRPADFRVHMAAGHTDGELFDWVSNGVAGTAMPAYRDQLSEEDRWHVINFIRSFAGGESATLPQEAASR